MNSPVTIAGSVTHDVFSVGNFYTYYEYCDTQGINQSRFITSQDMILRTLTVNIRLTNIPGNNCFLMLGFTLPYHTIRHVMDCYNEVEAVGLTYRKVDSLNLPVPANTQIDFDFEHSNTANTYIMLTCEYGDFAGVSRLEEPQQSACSTLPRLLGWCQ